MRNKFGGNCYHCGLWVKPGDGHFERYNRGWRVQHATCCLENRKRTQQLIEERNAAREKMLAEREA